MGTTNMSAAGALVYVAALYAVMASTNASRVAGEDVILGPVAVTANTFGELSSSFPISRVFDQSGLSETYDSLVTSFDSFQASHDNSSDGDWVSEDNLEYNELFPGFIDFDLGDSYYITKLGLWNDIQPRVDVQRGINLFTVLTDSDSSFSSPSSVGTFNAVDEGVGVSSSKQVFDLADSEGRFVRLAISSNHGGTVLQFGEIVFAVRPIPEPTIIPIDIKPGSVPNSVNLKSKGVLPVAILSTDEFDVNDVDIDSLLFGDPLLIDNGRTAVSPLRSAYEDVSGDGLLDLILKFSTPDLVEYQALGPDTIEGLLTGELLDGTPFEGMDSIRIVPPNGSNGNSLQVSNIPEPSTFALTALGLLGIGWRRRKRA